MDSFEWNKVFASVLLGGLLIMLLRTFVVGVEDPNTQQELAYTIALPGTESASAEQVKGPSLAELLATADLKKGAKLFKACASCHTTNKGGPNKQGPNLYGVLGRDIASADGYGYSAALGGQEGNWTWEAMDAWIKSPSAAVPGNKMTYRGQSRDDRRANLLAYLNSMSDNPLPLPEVTAEPAVAE